MSKEQKQFKEKLKPFHFILLSCFLVSVMLLNSNYVNNQREAIKSEKRSEELFFKLIQKRKLENTDENTKEVCSRASDTLNEYYRTGDLSEIDLDDKPIECEDKDKSYMQTLIDLVREYADDDSSDSSNEDSGENISNDRLRNLKGELNTDKLIDYLMRVLPFVIFLVFSVLAIFGWIICCICCCCDCCCCCCCKKEGSNCKTICFIFTYVFYALVVAVSVYGLTQSKKIFVGLANTECSMLKFFGQVLDGEIKEERPKWAGISGINNLIQRLINTIEALKDSSLGKLNGGITNINTKKDIFRTNMEDAGKSFYGTDNNYKGAYSRDYRNKGIENYPLKDTYVLDIVKTFGKKEGDGYTTNSSLYLWNQEFSLVAENADDYLETAKDGFDDILGTSFGKVKSSLQDGIDNLDKITKPFTDANDEIGDILADYSESIDKYGKLSVTIVFSVLMVMNIALGVLIILIYLFSSQTCADCCCIRCLFKTCTHVLWNVLALMLILSFLIGSLLGLIGRIGGDAMSLVSYIMSEENFNSNNPLILNKIKGDAKKYIKRCIHGDGDISQELDLGNALNSFDEINNVEGNITRVINQFEEIKNQCLVYNRLSEELEKRKKITTKTALLSVQGENEAQERYPIEYETFLEIINRKLDNGIQWSIESSSTLTCSQELPPDTYYHPLSCKPINKVPSTSVDTYKYAEILKDIDDIVEYANNNNADSVRKVIDTLKVQYKEYLDGYTDVLKDFLIIIHNITDLVREYSGDDDAFSFLNGKFIGTNLKIILKYLKYSLGVDLYTVGVCLIVVGCSLALSISSTILLIVLINIELKKNQEMKRISQTQGVTEFQTNVVISNPTVNPQF